MVKIVEGKFSSSEDLKNELVNNEVLIIRMNGKAPNYGSKYGQDVEPTGFYCLLGNKYSDLNSTYSTPYSFKFHNPLIVKWSEESDNIDWKYKIATLYNSKGKKLSNKIMKDGYDSIITLDSKGYTAEVVLLNTMNLKKISDINTIDKK